MAKPIPESKRHKSLLVDNATGDMLEIFAFSEGIFLRNDITDDPINVISLQALFGNPLASAIKFLPAVINVNGLLTRPPEEIAGRKEIYGDLAGVRPIDMWEKGRQFANRVTTFSYYTPNYPGAVFDDLMIESFESVAESRHMNAYSVTLNLKSVTYGPLGHDISKRILRGLQAAKKLPFPLSILATGVVLVTEGVGAVLQAIGNIYSDQVKKWGNLFGIDMENKKVEEVGEYKRRISGAYILQPKDKPPEGVKTKKIRAVGAANIQRGSIPWQAWQHRIGERLYNFEMWWQGTRKYPVITISDELYNPIVENRKLVLGHDLLSEVRYDPRIEGMYLIPMAVSPETTTITEENLGNGVELVIILDMDSKIGQEHFGGS